MTAATIPVLLTGPEMERALKVHRTTLFRMRKAGKLRAVMVGGAVRYDPVEVMRALGLDRAPAPDTASVP